MIYELRKILNNHRNGFTLIEFLIVFAITSVVVGIGVNSFNAYNSTQIHNTSVLGVFNMLTSARAKSISQVKPDICGSNVLNGYEVRINIPGPDYEQNVICGNNRYKMQQSKLNPRVSFSSASSVTSIFFDVSTGIVTTPGTIVIIGPSRTSNISVDKIGIVKITGGVTGPTATPSPGATVTPGITPAGTTTVVLSASPNPSSLYQNIIFTVTVTGNGCIPSGYVLLYADNSSNPFTGASLSGTNPKIGTAYYPALSVGTHPIQAKYTTSSSCPNANSAYVNQNVQ
jgi:prepilin-type N-terminal cleavage/methylation domain-containing protein